jgi:hypothetical protein
VPGPRLIPTQSHDTRISAALAHKVEQGASVAQIAEAIATTLAAIAAALSPIIGSGGFQALYRRTLHLLRPHHPWLEGVGETPAGIDVAALNALIAQQDLERAVAAGGALLQTFDDLLASLVGASLSERLLRAAWANLSNGPGPQDASPWPTE